MQTSSSATIGRGLLSQELYAVIGDQSGAVDRGDALILLPHTHSHSPSLGPGTGIVYFIQVGPKAFNISAGSPEDAQEGTGSRY